MLRIGRAAALRPGHENAGVAFAMTEQGAQSAFFQLSVQFADTPSRSRGAFRPRLAVA